MPTRSSTADPSRSTDGAEHARAASSAALQVAAARLLLEGAASSGVRDLVVSPGSRSTPLVLAALEVSALRVHDVVDERCAAFYALGQARATGRPSALVATSGTAGAHYFPAVLEAEAAHLPLLVFTADRPHERQECATSQTTDQQDLFGRHVRAFFDVPVAEARARVLRAVRRIGAQAAVRTAWPTPGPVHVNVRARKPLEPSDPTEPAAPNPAAAGAEPQRAVYGRPGAQLLAPAAVVPDGVVSDLAARLAAAERPLVVCGPAPLAQRDEDVASVLALLRALGFPVFAEVTSQLRFLEPRLRAGIAWCDELAVVLDSAAARRRLDPDLVLQLGTPPVAAGFEDLLEQTSVRDHVVIAEHGWPDPVSTATLVVQAPIGAVARALVAALVPTRAASSEWSDRLRALCAAARDGVADVLARGAHRLGEGTVACAVLEALPPGSVLALANSLPVRSAETFAPRGVGPFRVWSQRGLAGIDGLLSGVAGSLYALERETAPPPSAALLVGDLAFQHDLGGLAMVRRVETPLAVIVVQNRGGRIFEQLPLASSPASAALLPHFVMPQALEVESAARAFGIPFARVSDRAALDEALRSTWSARGPRVIEAVVDEHAAASERAALRRAMAIACGAPPHAEEAPR